MIRLRPSGADEVLIKRVRDWYEPGPGVFIAPQALFSPALLFTTGVNGAWYDPSDLNTLFQDAAGTTPVTAVEQPVGLMLDKSGRGNHAFNSSGNSANFPVLSARYNLLTKTEDFSDSAWVNTGATVTANAITAPDGTLTADALFETSATGPHNAVQNSTTVSGVTYTASIYVKPNGRTWVAFVAGFAGNGYYFDLQNLAVGSSTGGSGVVSNPKVVNASNGWILLSFNVLAADTTRGVQVFTSTGDLQYSFAGDTSKGIYIWGADFRVSNDALNQLTYQRVNTATDYDTVGFKPYLKFNGVNQWLQTNSIDFSYGDKMFVCAGVRKLSDAAEICLTYFGASPGQNGFETFTSAYYSSPKGFGVSVWGADYNQLYVNNVLAPATSLFTATIDRSQSSANEVAIRLNSANQTVTQAMPATEPTGDFGNYPLYLGARAGSSLWFNGRIYGLVVAGKQASAAEITSTETYINQKTGAY